MLLNIIIIQKKMNMKTMMRHHPAPPRRAKISQSVPSADKDVVSAEHLYVATGRVHWYNHFQKLFGSVY